MNVFSAAVNQTAFLLSFILLGYILSKGKFVPENSHTVLSKLENCVFIPALVLGTFMGNFTKETLGTAWKLLLGSSVLGLIAITLAVLCVKFCTKDDYERRIYTYGLSFSNFGFMGNAVVSVLFPDIFLEYLIFTLPLWTFIYLWGVPVLLMGTGGKIQSARERLKNFINPMFICTVIGMVIGTCGIKLPNFVSSAVSAAGGCMSPVAMLLTGMTIARFKLREVLNIKSVYLVTAVRLLAFPMLFTAFCAAVSLPQTFAVCALCSLAMPLGLNTIIITGAFGRDTRVPSAMALVSHVLSCITIPVIFGVFEKLI